MKCILKSKKEPDNRRIRLIGFSFIMMVSVLLFLGNREKGRGILGIIGNSEISAIQNVSIQEDIDQGGIPFLLQTDRRWADATYGNGTIRDKGCGPTCLSMVAAGLLKDASLSPVFLAKKSESWGYVEKENGTSWKLMTEGAAKLGLSAEELPLDEKRMADALLAGKPVICAMGPGDFTTEGHFIVLISYKEGNFAIRDPNSQERSDRLWSFEELAGQIRNIWCFDKR